jgi:DNA repair exonuclease SbcCD ATPase subunit
MDVLEKIVSKQKEIEKARADDFRALAYAIASGEEPDPKRVDRTLNAAGRSLDDLRAAVEVYQQRLALKAKADAAAGLRARCRELEEQIRQADEELAEAERRHTEVTAPLRAQLEVLHRQLQEAEQASRELARTCPDQGLRAQEASVQRQIAETQDRLVKARHLIKVCELRTKMTRDEAASLALYPAKQEEMLALAEQHEAKAREYEKEAAGLVKRLAELEKQMGAVQQSMLEP